MPAPKPRCFKTQRGADPAPQRLHAVLCARGASQQLYSSCGTSSVGTARSTATGTKGCHAPARRTGQSFPLQRHPAAAPPTACALRSSARHPTACRTALSTSPASTPQRHPTGERMGGKHDEPATPVGAADDLNHGDTAPTVADCGEGFPWLDGTDDRRGASEGMSSCSWRWRSTYRACRRRASRTPASTLRPPAPCSGSLTRCSSTRTPCPRSATGSALSHPGPAPRPRSPCSALTSGSHGQVGVVVAVHAGHARAARQEPELATNLREAGLHHRSESRADEAPEAAGGGAL